jgi:hypothetical protein
MQPGRRRRPGFLNDMRKPPMKSRYPHWNRALKLMVVSLVWLGASQAHAADTFLNRTICVYDPVGEDGPVLSMMEGYFAAALNWGVRLTPKPYTNEDAAAADFKSGKCDAVGMTGVHNMEFVKYAGSLDMVGGVLNYADEHKAILAMVDPANAKYMVSGNYETVAVVPGGKVFLFAHHKENLASMIHAAGKKLAVFGADQQALTMAHDTGAIPVPANITNIGPMFNSGAVEYAYAPSFAYERLGLAKGLGTTGGIADYALGMLSLQIDIYKNRFPPGFGQQSRTWVSKSAWDPAMGQIIEADNAIPKKYWVHIPDDRARSYANMLVQVRKDLWDNGWYDHTMQRMLKKIRCQSNHSAGECSLDTEGGSI